MTPRTLEKHTPVAQGASETRFLPYGRQTVTEQDIQAVVNVLTSDWLTQGPTIEQFESALAAELNARHVVACANGTAPLHLSMLALGIGPGDVVVTSPNTFLADANCARYVGADVRFVDVDEDSGNLNIDRLTRLLDDDKDHKIKVILPVHFGGQPVRLEEIARLAAAHGAWVVDDACHALGASYQCDGETVPIGSGRHSDITVFSFHPVKHVAMGEGGALTTSSPDLAKRLRELRSHGIARESFEQPELALDSGGSANPWYYEMKELGFNYRLTDMQAALGMSQLSRLKQSVIRRNQIAGLYRKLLQKRFSVDSVRPLVVRPGSHHAYHLFVVLIDFNHLGIDRASVMRTLRERRIGTQVNYIPIYLQPYYRKLYGFQPGDFPGADKYYAQALSLPMYPALTDDDVYRVVDELADACCGRRSA